MKVYVVEKVKFYDSESGEGEIFGIFSTKDKARECKFELCRKIEEMGNEYDEFICIAEVELDCATERFKEYMNL